MLKFIFLAIIALAVLGGVWVRFAPDTPDRWHQPSDIGELGHHSAANSHVFRMSAENAAHQRIAALDAVIRATPRTDVLAGSVAEGRITYVTRSKIIGFPDYTTLSLTQGAQGTVIEVFSRARYGKSDLGVNRARIEGWLKALGQGGT